MTDKTKDETKHLKLSKEEKEMLLEHLQSPFLQPEIDKAFRLVYATNVKQIVQATALEASTIWDKIGKLMPVITIIATGLFIVFALYGFAPIINAEVGAISHITATITCGGNTINVGNAIAQGLNSSSPIA